MLRSKVRRINCGKGEAQALLARLEKRGKKRKIAKMKLKLHMPSKESKQHLEQNFKNRSQQARHSTPRAQGGEWRVPKILRTTIKVVELFDEESGGRMEQSARFYVGKAARD